MELLTQRGHQVAALVARGLTNAQIAAQLVIGERTVVSNLEHITSKLGVRRRGQIPALIRDGQSERNS